MQIRELKSCSLEETQMDMTTIFTYLKGCHGDKGAICSVWAPGRSDRLAILSQDRMRIV